MALTAGDQGIKLIDQATGEITEMTPEQVDYQCKAIAQTLDGNTLSRPVIFATAGDEGRLCYYAGALSLHRRGEHEPEVRIGKDTAVTNNATLKKILAPWPRGVQFFTENDIGRMRFLALTRTVQAQAVEFETRQETQARIAELERRLARALQQNPHAEAAEGALVPYRPHQARRPVQSGSDLRLVEGWLPVVEEGGPHMLKAAVLAAVAPGGFRAHARHAWEALASLIEAYAAVAVQGAIPGALSLACQHALDDFVLAAGSTHAGQHAQLRSQWAAKADGPQALVASIQLKEERAAGRGRGGGGRRGRGVCFTCGKPGHIAAQCEKAISRHPASIAKN